MVMMIMMMFLVVVVVVDIVACGLELIVLRISLD